MIDATKWTLTLQIGLTTIEFLLEVMILYLTALQILFQTSGH